MLIDDDRTTPIGLFNVAESYWNAAGALEKSKLRSSHAAYPISFLYYHAIELYLKSYLRAQGHTVDNIQKKFGHDASRLSKTAQGLGLHFDDEDIVVLEMMAESDTVIRSRYIRTGISYWPSHEALDRTCRSLRQSVGKTLKNKGFPVRWVFTDT